MPTIQELFQVTSSEPQEHEVRLTLHGELDLMTAPVMKEAIETATGNGYRRMVIDLSELRFIDSTGLHLLVEAQRRMMAKRGETVMLSPTPHVAKVFQVMGLDRIFGLAA